MTVLGQIKDSQFSKQGRTTTSGVFEGTPQNVAIVQRGYSTPNASLVIAPIQLPIDYVSNLRNTKTYLEYLKSVKR
jgi:nucleoid-associated protein YgaU